MHSITDTVHYIPINARPSRLVYVIATYKFMNSKSGRNLQLYSRIVGNILQLTTWRHISSTQSHLWERQIYLAQLKWVDSYFPPLRSSSILGKVKGDMWWIKWFWSRFSPSSSVCSEKSDSSNFSITINHPVNDIDNKRANKRKS